MAKHSIWFLLTAILFSSCSVLKKEDTEQKVRVFIQKFEQSLAGDEKSILELFDTPQSKESVLSAITVLQNKDTKLIECSPTFASASVSFEDETIKVIIPVKFESKNSEFEYKEETSLLLWLKPRMDSYVVSKLGAESFYETFAKIKNEMKWEVQREHAFAEREVHYAAARTLESSFDSVVWFATYNKKPYYYVVTGHWTNYVRNYEPGVNIGVAMGVVDGSGKVVIPQEYDLIGTLGFSFSGIVEVKKNNKVGYYDFENRQLLIPAQYDVIIPYGKQNVLCLVKNEQSYGYYNFFHEYKEGFPSEEIKKWVDDFMFIPEKLQLKNGVQAMCEIPAKEHAGFGIVVPPSYLVRTGIFREVVGGITTTEFPLEGWTDYLETEGTVSQRVSESLLALVTTIRERYLEGRQEFYTHSKIVFVGPGHDTLKVGDIPAGETTIRKLDSLIEVKYVYREDYYYEQMSWPDIVPGYSYFAISEDLKIKPLKTLRSFSETQFVKLDSTYFTGKFFHSRYDTLGEQDHWVQEEINFFTQPTIKFMRDEILASYGVKLENQDNANFEIFHDVPAVTRAEAEQLFNDIDRHNIRFLEELLGEMVTVAVQ
jgi:hypothetical protein